MTTERQASRCGTVALAGAPNVGKSTLLNRIVDAHLSIATPKPQTTRTQVLGIATRGDAQIVFTDTPGIHVPAGLIHERMVGHARAGVRSADVVCWLVAADRGVRRTEAEELPLLAAERGDTALVVVINKMDLVAREVLLPIIAKLAELVPQTEVIPVSARSGENVELLVERLVARLPEGPWLYEGDLLSDQSARFFAAELVREQLFEQLDREMPYRVAVKIDEYDEGGKTTHIEASIYTDTDSSKKIIVGKGGQRIKTIGIAARKRIEELTGHAVYLGLHVRVKKDWQDDPAFLEDLGI